MKIIFLMSWFTFCCFGATMTNRYVMVRLQGSLGDQLFQVATALAISKQKDLDCIISLESVDGRRESIYKIFYPLTEKKPQEEPKNSLKEHQFIDYKPPFLPNQILLTGQFQSINYFEESLEEIRPFFSPSSYEKEYLIKKYAPILEAPIVVSLRIDTLFKDYIQRDCSYDKFTPASCFPDRAFYEKALSYFPKEAVFIVTSDYIPWAKRFLEGIDRPFYFIEGESQVTELYLQTLCHHHILSCESISWWGAVLNPRENKTVIARSRWFNHKIPLKGFFQKEWILLPFDSSPPIPNYGDVLF